ncbi:MAG TPA: signal peptide peptidase SppA [Candidatus Polarisedimenticolaceae bacterium]|nr:signal peptide peptidase SppA [Candidatus Polarisedimenticolaceae bacterium]
MRRAVVVVLALFGVLALLAVVVALVVGLVAFSSRGSVPRKTILEVDLEQAYDEYVPDEPIPALLSGKKPTVVDLVEVLQRAAGDDRVAGVVAKVGSSGMGLARLQEIRDAVVAFRKSGKPAVAWSETFGEFSAGNGAYFLATGFDQIYLQPSGDVGLTGLLAESPFLRGTLDKMGVVPRMDHRYEYKNAMNIFTEKGYTDPHREATVSLMESQFAQIVQGIAQARKVSEDEVRALADRGPFLGDEAVAAKLVDGLAYRDEVYAKIKEKVGGEPDLLYIDKYLGRAGRVNTRGAKIALVYGVGNVTRGESGFDPLFGETSMGSDTVAGALRAAADDADVKAILFRVDSPGGSYVASDTIWREVSRAREVKKKPVIVSMGDVAASGGYFVSMNADKIVAQPGTITGSIGVLAGKMYTKEMWGKIGLNWDEVHTSRNATMFTGTVDYTPEEWARFEAWLDRIYADFTGKVAAGRKLEKAKVLEIAKGRVWTGEQAKGLGLVDALGGFPVALALAKEAAHLPANAAVRLQQYPRRKSPFEMLFGESGENSEDQGTQAMVEVVQPLARRLRALGLLGDQDVLRLPPEAVPLLDRLE